MKRIILLALLATTVLSLSAEQKYSISVGYSVIPNGSKTEDIAHAPLLQLRAGNVLLDGYFAFDKQGYDEVWGAHLGYNIQLIERVGLYPLLGYVRFYKTDNTQDYVDCGFGLNYKLTDKFLLNFKATQRTCGISFGIAF